MIHANKLGLSGGIVWGLGLFLLTLLSIWTGYAGMFLSIIEDIYIGYTVTYLGSLIGLVYGFVDAYVGLYIFAWIYNILER